MNKISFFIVCCFLLILPAVCAVDLSLVNSKDWKDVYSVSLYTALTTPGERTNYITSESLLAASKTFTLDTPLHVFESASSPYIPSISSQLRSAGYTVNANNESSNFNLDLDIRSGSYILISDSNFRSSIAAASYASNKRAWVLFVNTNNVNDVVARITGAREVIAVGQFPRAVKNAIAPHVTKTINNENIYKDTQDLALLQGFTDTITLADGITLESEFFLTKNPVILSGFNRILDDTFTFLQTNKVKNVVIVGNQLATVGSQIRDRSQRTISVFIKFGQSDTKNIGNILSLTYFPLPQQTMSLNITKATYDVGQADSNKRFVAYFQNLGNIGVYVVSTVTLRQGGRELGTKPLTTDGIVYVAPGEVYPAFFKEDVTDKKQVNLGQPTQAEFYASYGISPSELDSFLTLENKFGPPFSIPVVYESLNIDSSSNLVFKDAAYYKTLSRIGVTVFANSTKTLYYTVKVNNLTVQAISQDFAKADQVGAQSEKTTYIPVKLDSVDLEENSVIPLTITYGTQKGQEYQTIVVSPPFKTQSSNTLLYGAIALVLVVLIVIIVLIKKKKSAVV